MLKRWAANIGALLAWLLVCVLALVVLAVGANLYQVFLRVTMNVNRWSNTLWVDLYYVIAGVLWMGFFIFMEHIMFSASSKAGLLLPRTLYVCGIEIIVIAILQLGLDAYGGVGWLEILVVAVELIVGGGMVWFARRKPRASLNS